MDPCDHVLLIEGEIWDFFFPDFHGKKRKNKYEIDGEEEGNTFFFFFGLCKSKNKKINRSNFAKLPSFFFISMYFSYCYLGGTFLEYKQQIKIKGTM